MAVAAGLVIQGSAWAWWDTQIMVVKDPPIAMKIEAEQAAPAGAEVVSDTPPFGPAAGGGKAVRLKPGAGTLTVKARLPRSIHSLYVIGRVAEADPVKHPGIPEWPMIGQLKVLDPDGGLVGQWSLPFSYLNTYYDTSRLFFPAHADGEYTLEYALTPDAQASLLVDRLEVRDVLGTTLKKGFKKGRYLHTDDEVAQLRRNFRDAMLALFEVADGEALKTLLADPARAREANRKFQTATQWQMKGFTLDTLVSEPVAPGRETPLDPAKLADRIDAFRRKYAAGYDDWNKESSGMKNPFLRMYGKPLPEATAFLQTGDAQYAQEVVETLIYWADRYPAIDKTAHNVSSNVSWNCLSRGVRFSFQSNRFGGFLYSGHETAIGLTILASYDAVFPHILANAGEFIAMAQTRAPWVRTTQDLIDYLDTRLVQHIGDRVNRQNMRAMEGGSESVLLTAIAVQGPNPAGERLARWLFTRTYWDMTNDGGLQDQAITGLFRDGVNAIGSVNYAVGSGLVMSKAAALMSRFIAAGGSREFDLSDPVRFPAVQAGTFFPLESLVAGGFQPRIGDGGRAIDGRLNATMVNYADAIRFAWRTSGDARMAWLLKHVVKRSTESDAQWAAVEQAAAGGRDPLLAAGSRNLEGFGLAILESGSEQDDFSKKRALTFRHGVGKGHAHADSLGLEYYAHGVRVVPDAGSRGGAPHPGDMRAHLGVTVDEAGMRNSGEINVSGTAWTTAFSPAPGAQVVSGSARFAAAPQVTRYERQAALIDVAGRDASYVFDVLRVAGGKAHTWSTHGPARDTNAPTVFSFAARPASSDLARRVLAKHNSPVEGVAGAAVSAAWTMDRSAEARMMAADFPSGSPPVVARCTLFGHDGDPVFAGDSDPAATGLENSQWMCTIGFLHVRREGGAGLQTVWPQLIESSRGPSLIKSAAELAVMPKDETVSAPVGLAVETITGQRDVLVADGAGGREVTAGTAVLNGRFGYVSRDGNGLRLAHLVGGTKLEEGDLRIAAEAAGFERRIQAVDYANRTITLDRPLPGEVAAGQEFLINAPVHPQVWQATAVTGATLRLRHSPMMYQSELLAVDEQAGEVVCAMNPMLLLADPRFYDGVTAANESGTRTWRVKNMRPTYIFMYLQEPLQEWHERYSDDDFPDADGDGKRTVTFLNWGGGDGSPARERVVVEVAFVDKDRQVIYFKLPDDPAVVAASGWQWAGSRLMDPATGRWMVNEQGRRWIPNYTGKQNAIALEGGVKDAHFTDADKDGRRVLRMYHFGVGDTVTMQTSVAVARRADGSYTVTASTPARVSVAGKAAGSAATVSERK